MSKVIIPAQPGFLAFYIDVEEDDPVIDTAPVVAWGVEPVGREHDVTPITYDGVQDWHGVVFPDGRVRHYVLEETFDSLDAVARAMRYHHVAKVRKELA